MLPSGVRTLSLRVALPDGGMRQVAHYTSERQMDALGSAIPTVQVTVDDNLIIMPLTVLRRLLHDVEHGQC